MANSLGIRVSFSRTIGFFLIPRSSRFRRRMHDCFDKRFFFSFSRPSRFSNATRIRRVAFDPKRPADGNSSSPSLPRTPFVRVESKTDRENNTKIPRTPDDITRVTSDSDLPTRLWKALACRVYGFSELNSLLDCFESFSIVSLIGRYRSAGLWPTVFEMHYLSTSRGIDDVHRRHSSIDRDWLPMPRVRDRQDAPTAFPACLKHVYDFRVRTEFAGDRTVFFTRVPFARSPSRAVVEDSGPRELRSRLIVPAHRPVKQQPRCRRAYCVVVSSRKPVPGPREASRRNVRIIVILHGTKTSPAVRPGNRQRRRPFAVPSSV